MLLQKYGIGGDESLERRRYIGVRAQNNGAVGIFGKAPRVGLT
jgi:hypothetical protein